MKYKNIKVLISDKRNVPHFDGLVLLWSSFKENGVHEYSIPAILERDAEMIRSRYLEYIYEFGESVYNGKTLIERLELEKGLSYWWMTLIAQKDVVQYSPHIYDVLKLLIVEDLLKELKVDQVLIDSTNLDLINVLKKWAQKNKVKFQILNAPIIALRLFVKNITPFKLLILFQAVIIFFKYVLPRFRFVKPQYHDLQFPASKIAIIDVLTHLDPKSIDEGRFASKYWTVLVDYLRKSNLPVIWGHWYLRHKVINRISFARKIISFFNTSEEEQQHVLIDNTVYPSQCISVLKQFIKLNFIGYRVGNLKSVSIAANSDLDLWQFIKQDWYRSFFGVQAILNLFFIEQLNSFVKKLPKQSLGVYIQENQPWEYALNYFWRLNGHGLLVGVAHTTIPYLDFRYFFDPRSFLTASTQPPLPDLIAVNGPDALEKMRASKFPISKIKSLEALRYMHLNQYQRKSDKKKDKLLNILILGDLIPEITNSQLVFLFDCIEKHQIIANFIFKPHPASISIPYEMLRGITISDKTIGEELINCDIVFVNNVTSGAADPYHIGVPVIIQNVGNGINFSPLFKRSDVFFVNDCKEFFEAYINIRDNIDGGTKDFFNIDLNIPLWKSIIRNAMDS